MYLLNPCPVFIVIIHDNVSTTIVTFINANNVYTGTLNKNKLL